MAPCKAGFAVDASQNSPGKPLNILSYLALLLRPIYKFFFRVIELCCDGVLAEKDPTSKPPEEKDHDVNPVADVDSYPIAVNLEGQSQKYFNQKVDEDIAFLLAFSGQIARQLDCEPIQERIQEFCDHVVKVFKSKSESLSNSLYNFKKPTEEQGEQGKKAVENCCVISNTPQAISEHNKSVNIKDIVSPHEIKVTNCSGGTCTSSGSSQQKAQQSQKQQCNQANPHEGHKSTAGGFGDDNDPPKRNTLLPIKGHYQEFPETQKNKVLNDNSEKERRDQGIISTANPSFHATSVPSDFPENTSPTSMPLPSACMTDEISDQSNKRFHATPFLNEYMLAGPTIGRDGLYLEGRDFAVRGELGRGKYGICEKIKDLSSGELLVRKKIKRQHFERNELTIWSRISRHSPYAVQLFGYSADRDHVYMFMELMDGDLKQICDDRTELELNETKVLAVMKPIIQCLKCMQDYSYVHADIKCDNVLFNASSGRIAIGDFGSSSACNDASELKYKCHGTVPYIPKEKFCGDEDRASRDIYACGCVMIHLLNGEPPWSSYEAHQIMYKVGSGEIPDIPENCSSEMKRLLEHMLNSDHKERPTAKHLLLDPMFADRPADKLDDVLQELLVDIQLLHRPAVPVQLCQDDILDTASPMTLDDVDYH